MKIDLWCSHYFSMLFSGSASIPEAVYPNISQPCDTYSLLQFISDAATQRYSFTASYFAL